MRQANKNQVPDKPPSQKRKKQEKSSILWHFESMDLVNRAMQGTNDLEQMMKDVLDALLSVFECDRAWLVYPCDPDSPTWQVPMERTRPEYPGALPIGIELPLDPIGAEIYRILRNSDGPVKFGARQKYPVPLEIAEAFQVQSFIAMAIYPKIGSPWSFGLHQCSYARVWTSEEERLFQEIGRRLSDVLTSLLAFRNLLESEKQIKQLIDASPVAMVVSSGAEERVEWVNEKFIGLFGYTAEDVPDVDHWWPLAYPDEAYRAEIKARWEARVEPAIRDMTEISPMEATVRCKDGSQRHIEFRLSSIGKKHLVTFVDLTERKRAENALHERERHSQSLLRLSRKLEQAQTYSDVLNAAQDEVRDVTGYQNLWAYLFTPDKKQAKALFAKGPMSARVMSEDGTATLNIQGDRMMEEFVETKEILVVEDAQTDERTDKQIAARMGNRTLIHVPILLFDRHLGSVGTGTFADEGVRIPTASEREYLMALASHMAVSFDRIHLLDERRQSEQALRENEEKFRTLIEQSAEGVILADENGTIVEWNYASERMTGLERSRVLGQPLWDILVKITAQDRATSEPRESIQSGVLEALRTGKSYLFDAPMEMEFYPLPGREKHYFHQTIFPIKTEKGYRIAFLIEDITERKQMTEALAAREREFRTLAEYSPDNIARYDVNCRTIYVNPTLEKTLGRPASEMLGTLPTEMEFIKGAKEYQEKMVEVLKTGKENEMNLVLPDMGEGVRYHNIRFVAERGADGVITGIQAIGRDLTEKKRADDILRESEEKYRILIQKIRAAVVVHGADTQILISNSMAQELLGLTEDQMLGKTAIDSVWHFFLEDGTTMPIEKYPVNQVIASRQALRNFVVRVHRPTKENDVWVLVNADPVFGNEDEITQVIVTFINITERKQAEEALRESEWRYREVFDNVLDSLYLLEVTDDGRFRNLEINPAFEKSTGLPRTQLIGKLIEETVPEETASIVNAKYRRCVESGYPIEEEVELDLPAGRRYFHSTLIPARDETGRVHRIIGISRDITERKRTEMALSRERELLRTLVENLPMEVYVKDRERRFLLGNRLIVHALGVQTMNEIIGKRDEDFLPPYLAKQFADEEDEIMRTGRPLINDEHTPPHKPDSKRWYLRTKLPLYDGAGNITGLIGLGNEITERKQMDEALRESQALYHSFIEQLPNPVFRKDSEGRYVMVNSQFCRITDIKAEDFLGRKPSEVAMLEAIRQGKSGQITKYAAEGEKVHELIMRTGKIVETEEEYPGADGRKQYMHVIRMPVFDPEGKVVGTQGIQFDVTERKRAEEALRASENRFRVLSDNAFVGIYIIQDGRLSYVNSTLAKIFGYTPEELTGAEPALVIHPDDQVMVAENIRRRIDGEIETIHYEFRGRCKDGSTKIIEVLGGRTDFSGRTAVIGNLMDITERIHAADEIARSLAAEKKARRVAEILREANESLSRTLHLEDILQNLLQYLLQLVPYDSANVMLLEGDYHLRVVALRGYERWTDLDAARKLVFDIREIPSLHALITTQKSVQIANTYEYPGWARVTGTEHIVCWLGIPIITDGQVIGLYSVDKVVPAFFTDEHRLLAEGLAAQAAVAIQNTRLHDQVRRANVELERRVADRTAQLEQANNELEAFAYSVSHDLRAPLRHIDGFIELLQKRLKMNTDDKSQHYMEMIGDSARKMGMLIDDLLSFSRMGRQEIYTSQVDLNDLVHDVLHDAETEIKGRNIHWKIANLPLVTGDRAMLRIVLANLIGNAIKFTRSTERAHIEIGSEVNESEIIVFIRDNGVGFDMKYADKLFGVFQRLHRQEDFEGTGIGLANVHRIIQRHGGRAWAEGEIDHGTTFYFSLPITA